MVLFNRRLNKMAPKGRKLIMTILLMLLTITIITASMASDDFYDFIIMFRGNNQSVIGSKHYLEIDGIGNFIEIDGIGHKLRIDGSG